MKIPEFLLEQVVQMNASQRTAMTVSCRDVDYIPKVKNAGTIVSEKNEAWQIMHNGVKVSAGGYHGDWMQDVIKKLQGHHEPQEEKVFYEILKRLSSDAKMIEFGSFWAYYSLWFNKEIKNAKNICVEPDPLNLELGKKNAFFNEMKNIKFENGAAGKDDGAIVSIALESAPGKFLDVSILSTKGILDRADWNNVDVLHVDTQGAELETLRGAEQSIKSGELRFVIISTHHYAISGDSDIHQKCLDFIEKNNGHIISSHTVAESYSGDGLIAASFFSEDSDFTVPTSINHTDQSLFRPLEKDVSMLVEYINHEE